MKTELSSLPPGAHVHLMGICGTAMASLAGLLQDRGFVITGSDQNVYPPMSTYLESRGISIRPGYVAENLDPAPDFVVVGNVISSHFPEAEALLQSEIPYGSLPESLGEFIIQDRHSVAVCGTHGKTTTTSLAAWVASCANLDPGFLIGGIAKNFKTSSRLPKGDWFIIEGDEYDSAFFAKVPKFTFYKPKTAILTSVEFDHADIYPNMDGIFDAFGQLMTTLDPEGLLIFNNEDPNVQKLVGSYQGTKTSYGWDSGDWTIANFKLMRDGLHFDVQYRNQKEDHLHLPMFGKYNAMNAVAVYALAKTRGWDVNLAEAFSKFQGIRRRQELIGEPRGIQVIEDFAHHPTAVRQTLMSFKEREGGGRLIAIFEPRSATSRRKYFQREYTEALGFADSVYICKPYDAEKLGEEAMNTDAIQEQLLREGTSAVVFTSVEEIFECVRKESQPGDTIVVMSNGGFQGIYGKLLKELHGEDMEPSPLT